MACAPSESSDQTRHRSRIRVFAVFSIGSWGPNVSSCGQRRRWSDWMDAQADPSLRWAQRSFYWFCHDAARLKTMSFVWLIWKEILWKYSIQSLKKQLAYEPPRDKTNNVAVRPAKTQISLGIRPVWSESSMSIQRVAKNPRFLHADSEDSDQTGRMPRLIWVFAGRTLTLLVLSRSGSN